VEKAKNLGQVVKNEQLKRAMFDRLAADATADLWHPEIRWPQCASPALRPFLWLCIDENRQGNADARRLAQQAPVQSGGRLRATARIGKNNSVKKAAN
jgi:hypothetical protein